MLGHQEETQAQAHHHDEREDGRAHHDRGVNAAPFGTGPLGPGLFLPDVSDGVGEGHVHRAGGTRIPTAANSRLSRRSRRRLTGRPARLRCGGAVMGDFDVSSSAVVVNAEYRSNVVGRRGGG